MNEGELSGAVRRERIDLAPGRALIILLLLDFLLLSLFLRWAYVTHHQITSSTFYGREYLALKEGGLVEVWGFLKLALAIAFTATITGDARRIGYFRALALLTSVMLLSDSLQIHERLNLLGSALIGVDDPYRIDPFVKAALAGGPLAAMLLTLGRMARADRVLALIATAPVIALGFVASVVDLLHAIWTRHAQGGRTWTALVEEGGEAVTASLALTAALFAWREARSRGTR